MPGTNANATDTLSAMPKHDVGLGMLSSTVNRARSPSLQRISENRIDDNGSHLPEAT